MSTKISQTSDLSDALVNSQVRAFHVLGGHIRYGMKLDMRLRGLAILKLGGLLARRLNGVITSSSVWTLA